MGAYDSGGWDDAIQQALQWEKDRVQAIKDLKKREAERFDERLRGLLTPAVMDKLHFEIIADFPEDGDPRYLQASVYATFRTSRTSYSLYEHDTWDVYPSDASYEQGGRPVIWMFSEDLQNQLVLLFLAAQERG